MNYAHFTHSQKATRMERKITVSIAAAAVLAIARVAAGCAGQTKGEGLHDFGAGWDVLSPAGMEIESDG
jgi:hypothetical protein